MFLKKEIGDTMVGVEWSIKKKAETRNAQRATRIMHTHTRL